MPATTSSPSASMETATFFISWGSFLANSSRRGRALSLLPQGKACSPREKCYLKATLTKGRCPYCYLSLPLLLPSFPPSPQILNHSQTLLAALASLPGYLSSWCSASPCLACDLDCTSHFKCHQGRQWKSSAVGQSLPSPSVKCQFYVKLAGPQTWAVICRAYSQDLPGPEAMGTQMQPAAKDWARSGPPISDHLSEALAGSWV